MWNSCTGVATSMGMLLHGHTHSLHTLCWCNHYTFDTLLPLRINCCFMATITFHFIFCELLFPLCQQEHARDWIANVFPTMVGHNAAAIIGRLFAMEFLPLMLISCIGAIQLIACWIHSGMLLYTLDIVSSRNMTNDLSSRQTTKKQQWWPIASIVV